MSTWQHLNEDVSLIDLANTRYRLGWPDYGKPVQIHCPTGQHADTNPSARYYPATNSAYCWTCQRSVDPVSLVAAQERIGFEKAAHLLAEWYGMSVEPDHDEDEVRALLARVGQARPLSPQDAQRLRLAASMARRAVSLPWADVEALLAFYDLLDGTDVDPEEWMTTVDSSLALR